MDENATTVRGVNTSGNHTDTERCVGEILADAIDAASMHASAGTESNVVAGVCIAVGVVICLAGYRILRPGAAAVGLVFGVVFAHSAVGHLGVDVCEKLLAFALCCGAVSAFLLYALANWALTGLLFVASVLFAREVVSYSSYGDDAEGDVLWGLTLYPAWVAVLISALAVTVVLRRRRRELEIVTTASLGAWVVTLGAQSLMAATNVPRWGFATAHVVLFVLGSAAQMALSRRSKRSQRHADSNTTTDRRRGRVGSAAAETAEDVRRIP